MAVKVVCILVSDLAYRDNLNAQVPIHVMDVSAINFAIFNGVEDSMVVHDANHAKRDLKVAVDAIVFD